MTDDKLLALAKECGGFPSETPGNDFYYFNDIEQLMKFTHACINIGVNNSIDVAKNELLELTDQPPLIQDQSYNDGIQDAIDAIEFLKTPKTDGERHGR